MCRGFFHRPDSSGGCPGVVKYPGYPLKCKDKWASGGCVSPTPLYPVSAVSRGFERSLRKGEDGSHSTSRPMDTLSIREGRDGPRPMVETTIKTSLGEKYLNVKDIKTSYDFQ